MVWPNTLHSVAKCCILSNAYIYDQYEHKMESIRQYLNIVVSVISVFKTTFEDKANEIIDARITMWLI